MATPSRTCTEAASLAVTREGERSVVRALRGSAPIALRQVNGAARHAARVAIVQSAATLVGADDVRLEVRVGAGASLELFEISATLVHTGANARSRIEIELAAGARLSFHEQPLIVAAGSALDRRLTVRMDEGAAALHRETLVLGRDGEQPGAASARTRVTRDGRPILDETLCTADLAVLRSASVAGSDTRVIASLGRFGVEAPAPDGAFALGPADALVRQLAPDARRLVALDALWAAWSGELLQSRSGSASGRIGEPVAPVSFSAAPMNANS